METHVPAFPCDVKFSEQTQQSLQTRFWVQVCRPGILLNFKNMLRQNKPRTWGAGIDIVSYIPTASRSVKRGEKIVKGMKLQMSG